ncbi:MAG: hypothetical protein IOC64_03720 [Methylobacterium sp.]|nr:hypothetical protein [Methylobacterium sp.]MCA3600400.1 hypothetical protein [Methylobacterium sp.]MCA3606191.1 hypothetical protein [Methylobacterium sp.]MCA3610162.1 hypothetical protein [Methylobacterium sp.]MCA3613577.1 hypothetical protein [Methylobacterium sp.]
MSLAKAGMGTGSREENARRQRSIFKRSMSLAKAGMDAGSLEENAIKQRDQASDLIGSDRKMLERDTGFSRSLAGKPSMLVMFLSAQQAKERIGCSSMKAQCRSSI